MPYVAIIGAVIQAGISIYGASQRPDLPSYPKLKPLNVQKLMDQAERYGQKQYDQLYTGEGSLAVRYPKLWSSKMKDIDEARSRLDGGVQPLVQRTLKSSGLEQVPEGGNAYKTAQQMGFDPVQTQQREFAHMTSLIAANPQVATKLSGAQLATLIARKNYQANQTAMSFAGSQVAAYNANQAASANQAATAAVAATGLANAGASFGTNYGMGAPSGYNPNPFNTGYYQQGVTYGTTPVYSNGEEPTWGAT